MSIYTIVMQGMQASPEKLEVSADFSFNPLNLRKVLRACESVAAAALSSMTIV